MDTIKVMPEMPSNVSGLLNRYPTLYNVDRIKVNIKKDFQKTVDYKNLVGKTTLADFCLGGRYGTTIQNIGRNATDLGSATKIGMRSNCYSNSNSKKYDEFYFYDFMSIIHINANYTTNKGWVADNPQDAKYIDGNYHISAEVQKVNNNIQYSNPIELNLDNFMPFIQKVNVWSYNNGITTGHYVREWKSVDLYTTTIGDGYVQSTPSSKCNDKVDLLNDLKILATSSEPMNYLYLEIKDLVTGQKLNASTLIGEATNTEKTNWLFTIKPQSSFQGRMVNLIFNGQDFANNDLLNTKAMAEKLNFNSKTDILYIPKRKLVGNSFAYKNNPGKYWFSKGTILSSWGVGHDDYHVLTFDRCGGRPFPEDSTQIARRIANCFKREDLSQDVKYSSGSNGAISILVHNVLPSNTGATITWIKDDVALGQFDGLYSLSRLAPGEYCYEIKCECCTFSDCIEVPGCPDLLDQIKVVGTCNSLNNGRIDVSAANGVLPYSFTAFGTSFITNGENKAFAAGLASGIYRVTIGDSYGCSSTKDVTVDQNGGLSIETYTENECQDNLGSINLNVTNNYSANSSASYLWNNGSVDPEITDLTPGVYIVTITTTEGCKITKAYTIQPSVDINSAVFQILGAKFQNGSFILSITGAYPIQYSISPSDKSGKIEANSTRQTIDGLEAGTYEVVLTDANGCVKVLEVVVPNLCENATISIKASSTPVTSVSANNGTVKFTILSGTSPFTWKITGPSNISVSGVGSNAIATNLYGGNYTVRVTDANGCVKEASVNVISCDLTTEAFNIVPTVVNSCPIHVEFDYPAKGIEGITEILTFPSDINVFNLGELRTVKQGKYCIELRTSGDIGFCGLPNNTVLGKKCYEPNCDFSFDYQLSCESGTISAVNAAGCPPFTYLWSNAPDNLSYTNYQGEPSINVKIFDANGCSATKSIDLDLFSTATVSGGCGDPGCIKFHTENNPNAPFSFSWNQTGNLETKTQSEPSICNLLGGDYSVTITDRNGCTKEGVYFVPSGGDSPEITYDVKPEINTPITKDGSIRIKLGDVVKPYSYYITNNNNFQKYESDKTTPILYFAHLNAGIYNFYLTDGNGCPKNISIEVYYCSKSPILNELKMWDVTLEQINNNPTSCNGLNLGALLDYDPANNSAALNLIGSTPIDYQLLSNQNNIISTGVVNSISTSATLNNLEVGNYYLLIKDATGCYKKYSFNISFNFSTNTTSDDRFWEVNGKVTGIKPFCTGGSIQIDPFIASYNNSIQYSWIGPNSFSSSNKDLFNLKDPGRYYLSVFDPSCNKNILTKYFDVNTSTLLHYDIDDICSTGDLGCIRFYLDDYSDHFPFTFRCKGNDGLVKVGNSSNICGLSAGNYSISIEDFNGCLEIFSNLKISEPNLNFSHSESDCSQVGNDGSISFTINCNNSLIHYQLWDRDNNKEIKSENLFSSNLTRTISGLKPGKYLLSYSANTCLGSIIIIVKSYCENVINLGPPVVKGACNGNNDGFIGLNLQIKDNPLHGIVSITWSLGTQILSSTNTALQNLVPGNYKATVDYNGCKAEQFIFVGGEISNIDNVCVEKGENIEVKVKNFADGDCKNCTFMWEDGAIGSVRNNLGVGRYRVKITSTTGCFAYKEYFVYDLSLKVQNLCNASNQIVSLSTNPTLQYTWSDGKISNSRGDLLINKNYSVEIRSFEGHCSFNKQIFSEIGSSSGTISQTYCGVYPSETSIILASGMNNVSYLWDDGFTSGINKRSNLPPGKHSVTLVKGSLPFGCLAKDFEIYDIKPVIKEQCVGTVPYKSSISFNNNKFNYNLINSSINSDFFEFTSEGNRTIVITNKSTGCKFYRTFSVGYFDEADIVVIPSKCKNGEVTISSSNNILISSIKLDGNELYNYQYWQGAPIILQSSKNEALLEIHDIISGCTISKTINFVSNIKLQVKVNLIKHINITQKGSIDIDLLGSNSNKSIVWSGPNGFYSTEIKLSNLTVSGEYCYIAKDDCIGNEIRGCITIVNCKEIRRVLTTTTSPPCQIPPDVCMKNGSITINSIATIGIGNFSGYRYKWGDDPTNPRNNIDKLFCGSHSVTITDNYECSTIEQIILVPGSMAVKNGYKYLEDPPAGSGAGRCYEQWFCGGEVKLIELPDEGLDCKYENPNDCRIETCYCPGTNNIVKINPKTTNSISSDCSDSGCWQEFECPPQSRAFGFGTTVKIINNFKYDSEVRTHDKKDTSDCLDKNDSSNINDCFSCETQVRKYCELNGTNPCWVGPPFSAHGEITSELVTAVEASVRYGLSINACDPINERIFLIFCDGHYIDYICKNRGAIANPESGNSKISSQKSKLEVYSIYPNPSTSDVTISYDNQINEDVILYLLDIFGRKIDFRDYLLDKGIGSLSIDAKNFPNSVYHVVIAHGAEILFRSKVIKL
ncbi:MAG: T9SS type A sorting domain-containing protein [Saprospiraceae bacterium]